jgi:L-asparagine permease
LVHTDPVTSKEDSKVVDKADAGYQKGLKSRHIRMIAIGGSIGTGLFLGAGGRLAKGGPALAIAYAICGLFAFIMVRALGELSIHRPSSGAFVSYAREFMGEKGAYVTGWLFFLDWATSVMADITAVALYLHFWTFFQPVPQWVLAMIALAVVFTLNMFSVKFFGEAEFWFAAIKVAAILAFMAVAIWAIITGHAVGNSHAGLANLTDHGGFFPLGVTPLLTLSLGVIFAFGGTEMVGVAAGEAADARKILPKAVNSMILRIFVFYVGLGDPHDPRAALELLLRRRVALRHLLLRNRGAPCRRHHAGGRADRRAVLPQRRASTPPAAPSGRWRWPGRPRRWPQSSTGIMCPPAASPSPPRWA